MKRFAPLFILCGLCAGPIFGQELPPLAPVPAAPLSPAQSLAQPVEPQPAPAALAPSVPSVPNKELETAAKAVRPPALIKPAQPAAPKKEITYSEYKAARKLLYKQMRASESAFRRSGMWFDLSAVSFDYSLSSSYGYDPLDPFEAPIRNRHFSHYGIYSSFGRVLKGFMSGVSFQFSFEDSYQRGSRFYGLPKIYDIAGVLGYRIAPDRFVGMRLMFHVGYGSAFSGHTALTPSGALPIRYVLLMPELKVDFKVYKSLVFTLGLAYKGTVFVGESRNYASALQSELGFNGIRALRVSLGLAVSY